MLKKLTLRRSKSPMRPTGRPKLKDMRAAWLSKPKEEAPSPQRVSDFLSKPISLWFLSSVALGVAGYLYGNLSNCRKAQIADNRSIHRQISEMVGRAVDLELVLHRNGTDRQKLIEDVKSNLDPNKTFIFLENKGRGNPEMEASIEYTLSLWDQGYPSLQIMRKIDPPLDENPLAGR